MSGVTIHYMRDNHTFRPLPLDVEAALKILRDERDAGQTYGMLCSKQIKNVVHASSAAEWDDFELRAREWLEVAIKFEVPPTPEDELTRLRERSKLYEQLREVIDNGSESMTHEDAVEELTRLRAEVDALRADAERLDWLTRMIPGNALRRIGVEWPAWSPENARAAIDAARAALKEKTNG